MESNAKIITLYHKNSASEKPKDDVKFMEVLQTLNDSLIYVAVFKDKFHYSIITNLINL